MARSAATNHARDANVVSHELEYELDVSPPASLYSIDDAKHPPTASAPSQNRLSIHTDITNVQATPSTTTPPQPSFKLLFSLLSLRQCLTVLYPAIAFSLVSGGIAPFMTLVVGQVFNSFAQFPLSNPSQEDRDKLMHDVGIQALELVGLAAGSVILSSITSCLWIWTGEHNAMALGKRVYRSVTGKDMAWFDTKMGSDASETDSIGAGGMMTQFQSGTNDVRQASSLASGMLIQHLTTTITCLALAFSRSWALTLVILSAVPILSIIQGVSQRVAEPLLMNYRKVSDSASSLLTRAFNGISTVKTFNAEAFEHSAFLEKLSRMARIDLRLFATWGTTSGFTQISMMGMFVQAFWFGAKLVRDGTVAPGDVMAVFWACLIATNNLQMAMVHVVHVTRGKVAMASLLALVDDEPTPSSPSRKSMSSTKLFRTSNFHQLRKIVPSRCTGEIAFHDVTFAYPSRPSAPVLRNVNLFLPAQETTFIVGGSGSGKSTIAQLLLRTYQPQDGAIHLDNQELAYLDENWSRQHIGGVSQGCILFDMSVHDNVSMGLAGLEGRDPENATRGEVVAACTAALMHEFVRDLPEGYDTKLGKGGESLSGGQKQRLAIARARLRDPTVLILDEATSALDPTSRLLVFEAIKHWRQGKTTIVITHDLSQITGEDFVYVLKDGEIGEQGYRYDLEISNGEFRRLLDSQQTTGGFLPTKEIEDQALAVESEITQLEEEKADDHALRPFTFVQEQDTRPKTRPITFGNWMFDVVTDLTAKNDQAPPLPVRDSILPEQAPELTHKRRPSSVQIVPALPPPASAHTYNSRRHSLQFTPTSATFSFHTTTSMGPSTLTLLHEDHEDEKDALEKTAVLANSRRPSQPTRTRWDTAKRGEVATVKVEAPTAGESAYIPPPTLLQTLKIVYPTIENKPLLFIGLLVCVCSGSLIPVFSFFLSRLFFAVSSGSSGSIDMATVNKDGGLVLGIVILDGLFLGIKFFIMEHNGSQWIQRLRDLTFKRILGQDKKWFDQSENKPEQLVQTLMQDGDDARNIISTVIGQCLVVTTMLSVGLIWAMTLGWQLTLAGIAIVPFFGVMMFFQSRLVAVCEFRNKNARSALSGAYYEAISNIRGIRSMALDGVFQKQFDKLSDNVLSAGLRGAFVEGCTFGVTSGLIYLAEAVLFYIGAVLVARGTYTYLHFVQVLNLVVFSVTLGAQLMAFTEKIHKAVLATRDFMRLANLPSDTDESRGDYRAPVAGNIVFDHVKFAYPSRPDVPVLDDFSLKIKYGESVAIVGTSGSGKSTVASLLQRFYEPQDGKISVGQCQLWSTDVKHIRRNISVVSQNPYLFDASVTDNIIYGEKSISSMDARRAAMAANAHEFITSLPQGYDTNVGENAALLSGGQSQRISIARALVRPSKVLVLDECTSALDSVNQAAVLEAVNGAKEGRTVIMVTHKLQVMQQCDRIVVLDQGRVAEQGSYEQLMQRKGVFAALASGGEWAGQ